MFEMLQCALMNLEDAVTFNLIELETALFYTPSSHYVNYDDVEISDIVEPEEAEQILNYDEMKKFDASRMGKCKKYRKYWLHQYKLAVSNGEDISWAEPLLAAIAAEKIAAKA